jgi:hypothetical protein
MKFWKKYKAKKELEKAKKELREKLEKARFVNFYGEEIDLNLGEIIGIVDYEHTTISDSDDDYTIYYILLRYNNFVEQDLNFGQNCGTRNDRYNELCDFIDSGKFTERLNEYEELKREYEQL